MSYWRVAYPRGKKLIPWKSLWWLSFLPYQAPLFRFDFCLIKCWTCGPHESMISILPWQCRRERACATRNGKESSDTCLVPGCVLRLAKQWPITENARDAREFRDGSPPLFKPQAGSQESEIPFCELPRRSNLLSRTLAESRSDSGKTDYEKQRFSPCNFYLGSIIFCWGY